MSFTLNKPLELAFIQRPRPELSSPHDVLVSVAYTGICGSDVHYWQHGSIGSYVVRKPMVLGHESSGTIVAIGSAVTHLQLGDRVALEQGFPCCRCNYCLGGKYNLCREMAFASTPPYDGTLTGFWLSPAQFCYRLPDSVSLREGALVEPLAVAVHALRLAGVRPGNSVVVMGAGSVGLLCAAVARAFGASVVVSVDIVQSKLLVARALGATHTYLSRRVPVEENAAALIGESGLRPSGGADIVIEASGAEPSIQACAHVVRVGGTFIQVGLGKPDVTFPILTLCAKEVDFKGSFRYGSGDYALAIDLLATRRVDVRSLISETVPFSQAEVAFNKFLTGQVIKILIAGPNQPLEEGEHAAPRTQACEATAAK